MYIMCRQYVEKYVILDASKCIYMIFGSVEYIINTKMGIKVGFMGKWHRV